VTRVQAGVWVCGIPVVDGNAEGDSVGFCGPVVFVEFCSVAGAIAHATFPQGVGGYPRRIFGVRSGKSKHFLESAAA